MKRSFWVEVREKALHYAGIYALAVAGVMVVMITVDRVTAEMVASAPGEVVWKHYAPAWMETGVDADGVPYAVYHPEEWTVGVWGAEREFMEYVTLATFDRVQVGSPATICIYKGKFLRWKFHEVCRL